MRQWLHNYSNRFFFLCFLPVWLAVGLVAGLSAHAQSLPPANAGDPFSFSMEYGVLAADNRATFGLENSPTPVPVLVLWLEPTPGYHSYAHKPGHNSAVPTTVHLAGSSESVQLRYMPGQSQPDIFDPSVLVQVYAERTPVFLLFPSGNVPKAELSLSLLACSDKHCIPVQHTLALPYLPRSLPKAEDSVWYGALLASNVELSAVLPPSAPALWKAEEEGILNARTSVFRAGGDAQKPVWNFNPVPFQGSLEVEGLGKALFMGLLAGLILNFMPCVLPVLSLKLSTLLMGERAEQDRLRAFREHNLFFSAGILTWFSALALLFGGADLAWGQLFQSNGVVFVMALVVFCLGLALFDVFHLPGLDLGRSSSNPRVQAFSTGLLATLLATPCSGPLLGGVLSWALLQSVPVLLMLFGAMGLGMALPYLFLAWKPGLSRYLPKPGPWLQSLERLLGFFLLGTALYLLSILPAAMLVPSLVVFLASAVAAWAWGRWGSLAEKKRKALIGGGAVLAVLLTTWLAFSPDKAPVIWQSYTRDQFQALLGTKALLLEFTADWCPSCKVLERTTLSPKNMLPLARENDLTLIRVDLTHFDPETQNLLRSLGSASIPLLAIFPSGERSRSPIILRDIYSAGQMRDAIEQALRP